MVFSISGERTWQPLQENEEIFKKNIDRIFEKLLTCLLLQPYFNKNKNIFHIGESVCDIFCKEIECQLSQILDQMFKNILFLLTHTLLLTVK